MAKHRAKDGPIHLGGPWPIDLQAASDLVVKCRRALRESPSDVWGPMASTLAGAVNEVHSLREENERLRSIIDAITGPPMTIEEAEAAYDESEAVPLEGIDIERIIAYAKDPANQTPEMALDAMLKAARATTGFDAKVMADAEACLKRRMCLD